MRYELRLVLQPPKALALGEQTRTKEIEADSFVGAIRVAREEIRRIQKETAYLSAFFKRMEVWRDGQRLWLTDTLALD